MLLEDKVIFITGSSRGIGRFTALEMASHGAFVILHGQQEERLSAVADEIKEISGSKPLAFAYNVTDMDDMKRAFKDIQAKYGQLDGLVNNAGLLKEGLLGMLRPEDVQQTMDVNLHAVLYHMQYASRIMMRKKSGSIINISSILGITGEAGHVAYAASKAAVIGATKSASKELARANIRVNTIAPGFIQTDLLNHLTPEQFEQRVKSIPLGRAGSPEDVAKTAVYLASDLSVYVTGQVIGVDGGMTV